MISLNGEGIPYDQNGIELPASRGYNIKIKQTDDKEAVALREEVRQIHPGSTILINIDLDYAWLLERSAK